MNDAKEKPIKVSDGSQKWKIALFTLAGGGFIYLGVRIINLLTQIRDLLQICH